SGKSQLALALLRTAGSGALSFARLVSDDRCHLEAHHGRLVVLSPAGIAGLIEVRGLGIRHLPFEPIAVVGLVVDLAAADAERLPAAASRQTTIEGIRLPRLAVAPRADPLPQVLAALFTVPAPDTTIAVRTGAVEKINHGGHTFDTPTGAAGEP
ncbi:MAG TPA: serine kinase, partial [Xanthobacteraceae bacterium]